MANTPKERQEWIYNELVKNPLLLYKEIFPIYTVKFAVSRVTFDKDWKKSRDLIGKYQAKVNAAKTKASIALEVKAVKEGLRSKMDRLLLLQELVDECLLNLTTGNCNDFYIFEGKQKEFTRKMTQREINDTRKTLQTLQSEISKIEGDYASIKNENITTILTPEEKQEKINKLKEKLNGKKI